jgi:hypothetical protein
VREKIPRKVAQLMFVKLNAYMHVFFRGKRRQNFGAPLVIFKITAKRKQYPKRRKFAQSGRTAQTDASMAIRPGPETLGERTQSRANSDRVSFDQNSWPKWLLG